MKFYGYKACSTCRKAQKFLEACGREYEYSDITQNPPSRGTLEAILQEGSYTLSDLFNKSGMLYREMKMKDKIKTISQDEALTLLAENGKLIKRPIVIDETNGFKASVGFKEETFSNLWGA